MSNSDTELVELAGGVRKVRTIEGAQFYGLPIGAPITADVINKKNAEKAAQGIKPPSGAVSSGHVGLDGKPVPEGPQAKESKLQLKLKKTELTGTKKFKVGKTLYSAPDGSKLILSKNQPGISYILTPDGKVHAFRQEGEIEIPSPLDAVLATKFSGDLSADPNYSEEEFGATASAYGLDGLQIGAVLTNPEGVPQFEKLPSGQWEHTQLGAVVEEKDLQKLFDDGELIPEKNPADETAQKAFAATEAANFADMSKDEFLSAVDAMPVGTQLGTSYGATITKKSADMWATDSTDTKNPDIDPPTLYMLKSTLKPQAPSKKKDKSPLNGGKPQLNKGDVPTAEWLKSADPGAEISYSTADADTIWTKGEDGSWSSAAGGTLKEKVFLDAAEMAGNKLVISKKGKKVEDSGSSGVSQPKEKKSTGQDKLAGGSADSGGSGEVPQGVEPTPGNDGSAPYVSASSFTGDTPEQFSKKLVDAPPGTKLISEDGSVPYRKQPEGHWTKGKGTKAVSHNEMYAKKDQLTLIKGTAPDSPIGTVIEPFKLDPNIVPPNTVEEKDFKDWLLVQNPGTTLRNRSGSLNVTKGTDGLWNSNTIDTDIAWDVIFHMHSTGDTVVKVDASAPAPTTRVPAPADLVPGEGDYSGKATEFQIENATIGDKVMVAFGDSYETHDAVEFELDTNGDWVNTQDKSDKFGGLTMMQMAKDQSESEQVFSNANNAPQGSGSSENYGSPVPANKVIDLAPGAKIKVKFTPSSGSGTGKTEDLFTKNPDGSWSNDDKADYPVKTNGEIANMGQQKNTQIFLISGSTSENKDWLQVGDPPDEYWMQHAAVGATVVETQLFDTVPKPPLTWTKISESTWSAPDTAELMGDLAFFVPELKHFQIKIGVDTDSIQPVPDTPDIPEGVIPGSVPFFPTLENLGTVPVGGVLQEAMHDGGSTISYTKIGPNLWQDNEEGMNYEWNDSNLLVGITLYLAPVEDSSTPESPAPPASPDAEPLAPWELELMAAYTPKVGDTILGVPDLDKQSSGTKLTYTKKDGSTSSYTKLDNGMWLTPGGSQYLGSQLKSSANSGKFKVESIPDPANSLAAPSGQKTPYVAGDTIKKFGHLREMPVGQILSQVSVSGKPIVDYQKNAEGKWFGIPNEKYPKSYEILPNELAEDVTGGFLKYVAPQSTDLDVQLVPGAVVMSKTDVQDAIDALEAHTGFQINYGLKSLGSENLLSDSAVQNAVKQKAVAIFPDLKPKPAFVAYLKDKIGIKTETPAVKAAGADEKNINIGSRTPETGVQGSDGGKFSLADIEDAVAILEAYPGKLFKSELNKKLNALGALDPNKVVGFDKDKLVTKQKFIDVLKAKVVKYKKGESAEASIVGSKPTFAQFEELPVGSVIDYKNTYGDSEYSAEKMTPEVWKVTTSSNAGLVVPTENWKGAVDKGFVTVSSTPDSLPGYAQTPAAVQDKTVDAAVAENFTGADVAEAPIGTVLKHIDGKFFYTKIDDNTWSAVQSGEISFTIGNAGIAEAVDDGTVYMDTIDGPEFNQSGLTPGKYSSGGKAYMIVHADGTGTYVNSKGMVTKLTPAKVKSNHKAGMNLYLGMPDTIPTVTDKPASVKKKKPLGVMDIADGTYFSGSPNSPKSTVYTVEGDNIQVFKPKTSTDSGSKIGGKPTKEWMAEASDGAKITHKHYASNPVYNYTKKDGKWYSDHSPDTEITETDYIDLTYYWSNYKIAGHGTLDPVSLPKAKLQSLFAQGKLLDSDGNSVLPDGYSGSVHFFGGQTTIPALLAALKKSEEFDPTDIAQQKAFEPNLKASGIYYEPKLIKAYVEKHYGQKWEDLSTDERSAVTKKLMIETIGQITSGLDIEIPESDASVYFEWNELGEAKYPLNVAALSNYLYSTSDYNTFIKSASASIGGGKIIGQHSTKMTKQQKITWVSNFKNGNFKGLYTIESAAAATEGKAHVSGYLHPGYEGNEKTNTISWGAAVDGEVSALTDVEGDWSSSGVTPSMDEVNNYLIKAQMQNPTFLTNSERRDWYTAHRAHNKTTVDQLSASAMLRKKEGQKEFSDPITWTDNVVPAKSYDSLFDDNPYPVSTWTQYGGSSKAVDYLNDHPITDEANKELWEQVEKAKTDMPGYNEMYYAKTAVPAYFQKKADEAEALALIPVYTLKPNQTVKKSTHPVFQYEDQFGNQYFFKPRPDTKLDKYRSEVEHLGNQFGKLFGFSTASSTLVEIDGKYGQLQRDLGGISDLMGFDYSTLNATQIADIGSEHILDHFLDNDDSKGDNAKILPNGHVVGIDKGRAFKHYGAWKSLSADSNMDSNAHTIYNQLYTTIRSGNIDKETVDKAYLAIQKKAEKMAKISDLKIEEMLSEGMANRDEYDNAYTINGKKVPNTYEGLVAAVLDRKANLPQDIEAMWKKIYKDSGFGDLPEPKPNEIEGVITGLDSAQLHEEVFVAKVSGKTAMLSGAHIIGGTALVWKEKSSDGSADVKGEMFLGPKKQKELLSYFLSNATSLDPKKAQSVQGFEGLDTYSQPLINGAKTVNHHAVDKEYNETTYSAFLAAQADLQKELAEWTPNLQSNTKLGSTGEDAYKFSTGKTVSMAQIDQYKMMLDHYESPADFVQIAHDSNTKVKHITPFEPKVISSNGEKYVKGDEKLVKLSTGEFLYNSGTGEVSIQHNNEMTIDAISGKNGWTSMVPAEPEKPTSSVKITHNSGTHETTASFSPEINEKTANTSKVSDGASGSEFQITLETGEKIFWRNSDQTSTAKGQQGKLTFVLPNKENPADISESMERIRSQLEVMGISTEASSHEQAELTYWREMYGILENRHLTGKEQEKYKAAYTKMQVKVKELGGNEDEFLENLSEIMDPEEEIQYWRELYSEFWPDEVQNLIFSEGYLPKYDHQNLATPELETGKPYWDRFDITFDDIIATNALLMHSSGGEPNTVLSSGALLGGEERLRQLGKLHAGGSYGLSSSLQDQNNGSSHQIYTRITTLAQAGSYNFLLNPRLLMRTRTYTFDSDHYGDLNYRKTGAPASVLKAIANNINGQNGGNETMTPHMASLLDSIEIAAFDYAEKRNEIIQLLKKLGIEQIRGVPIEDRLVMRTNMSEAIEKVKKTWQKKISA